MKRILVTGGAGFIGSNFIKYMLKKYPAYNIVCLDALTYAGELENLLTVERNKNYKFVQGDISDVMAVEQLFAAEHFDTVINFAAESHVDRSIIDPGIFLRTNVLGTQVLLDACRKYGVSRFHQISTDEVYGDLPLERIDELFTETTPLNPSSPYSASKASADLLVMAYHRTYGMPVTISRCSNNYGPHQLPEKLIPLMVIKAMCNKPLPVYGAGENIRDWLHVDDHVRAVDQILHKGRAGEIYNIGGNNEVANIDLVKGILDILNKPTSLINFVEDRKGHDLRYAVDSGKIRDELGWLPEIDFNTGLKEAVRWYAERI